MVGEASLLRSHAFDVDCPQLCIIGAVRERQGKQLSIEMLAPGAATCASPTMRGGMNGWW
jgi:hypothetical protein